MKDRMYSGFKKVAEDNKSATMRHENGHEIKIAKSGLSRDHKRRLEALPLYQSDPEAPVGETAPVEEVVETPTRDVASESQKPVNITINNAPPSAQKSESTNYVHPEIAAQREAALLKEAELATKPSAMNLSRMQAPPAPAPMPAPASVQEAPMPDQGLAAAAPAPVVPVKQGLEPDQAMSLKGINEQKQAANQVAALTGQRAAADALVIQQQMDQQQKMFDTYQKQVAELDADRMQLQKDIKDTKIDPDHYLKNMSTGSKIATVFGLILGGLGGGLTGKGNTAQEQLNREIDADINAQKENLGKKNTLLDRNMKQLGNLNDAMAMTKTMMNDMVSNHLKTSALKVEGPMAKAAALNEAGKLDMESAKIMKEIGLQRSLRQMMGGQNSGGASIMDLPKDMQNRAVQIPGRPGVMIASSDKGADKVRDASTVKQQFDEIIQKSKDLLKGGPTMPMSKRKEIAEALESQATFAIKNAETLGALSGGDLDLVKGMMPNFSSLFTKNQMTKLKQLEDYNDTKFESTLKNNIMNYKPSAPKMEIKTMGGVQYQKVPGGWQRVK